MAEAVGLAVGFIGLAGLFSTCVDCFKLVEVYDSRSQDFEMFQTMLDNQQFHFMAWGKACGFMDIGRTKSRFDDPLLETRNHRIEQTMERIQSLLTNGDNLKEKYGLKVKRAPVGTKLIEGPARSAFSKVFSNTKAFWNTSLQRKSYVTGTIRWAVSDKENFENLIQVLRDLLDDLNKLTEDIGVAESQRLVVEYELDLIDDEASLEAITAASACDEDDSDDVVSRAASRRLSQVKAQSVANESVNFDDSISMASVQRFAPSISTIEEEEVEGVIQEITITRVPLSQWRKVKTRAGILPWLGVLVVATGTSAIAADPQDEIQPLSRANTLDVDLDPAGEGKAVRLAINSRTLIHIVRKITGYRLSTKQNVLVYPFKPLIAYESEIKQYMRDISTKLEKATTASDEQPKSDDAGKDAHATKSDEDALGETAYIERLTQIKKEMQCLIQFMDEDMQHLFEICFYKFKNNLKETAFPHLWLLFQPGDIIVTTHALGDVQAYQILHVSGGRPIIDVDNNSKSESLDNSDNEGSHDQDGFAIISSRECTDFIVDCFYIDFDGSDYGPRPQRFCIPEYAGMRDCSSLPISLVSNEVRERLEVRGADFRICNEGGQWSYSGLTLDDWDNSHRDTCIFCSRNSIREHLDDEIIIDFATAAEHRRNSGCTWNPSFGGGVIVKATRANKREAFENVDCNIPNCKSCTDVFDDAIIDLYLRDRFIRASRSLKVLQGTTLTNDQLILLPYRICGYSLLTRRWYPLHVSRIAPVMNNEHAFDDLVVPQQHKALLSALIRNHLHGPTRSEFGGSSDLIRGRGKGTLILLHGPPGVGKTFTAEVLSQSLKKPMFRIRTADLGTTPNDMGRNLSHFLKLVERWDCILLMSEADVFLAQRQRSDREGTNITAVFLDALEYFSGILIMTTNRVGVFDEAFMSRIHLPLYYPPLDLEGSLKLWKTHLYRLKRSQSDDQIRFDERKILKWAQLQYRSTMKSGGLTWNGRQIRNTITTAITLAREDAKRLGQTEVVLKSNHFNTVGSSDKDFKLYLNAIRGFDADDRARKNSERLQDFRSSTHPDPSRSSRSTGVRTNDSDSSSSGEYQRKARQKIYCSDSYSSDSERSSHVSHNMLSTRKAVMGNFESQDEDDGKAKQANESKIDSDEDDLEVQELEIKLQIAKLKRQQKSLQAKRARKGE